MDLVCVFTTKTCKVQQQILKAVHDEKKEKKEKSTDFFFERKDFAGKLSLALLWCTFLQICFLRAKPCQPCGCPCLGLCGLHFNLHHAFFYGGPYYAGIKKKWDGISMLDGGNKSTVISVLEQLATALIASCYFVLFPLCLSFRSECMYNLFMFLPDACLVERECFYKYPRRRYTSRI